VTAGSRLTVFLKRHSTIGVDTNPFIYHLQDDPRYNATTSALFAAIEEERTSAVTSTITMLALLVRPLRDGRATLVNTIDALGSRYPNLRWVPTSLSIATRAAFLRASHRLSTPDAIQLATALEAGASGFVTNDASLARVEELEVFLIDRDLS